MANVLLTQRCVRSCPYCFAKQHMAGVPEEDCLGWEDLIYITDFLEASGEKHVSLLGGEPALHPHFVDFIIYLLERGFAIRVFTTGIMPAETFDKAAGALANVTHERLGFTCNLNNPRQTPAPFSDQESIRKFLRMFGKSVVPGFNLYRKDFELDFLFPMYNEYGLQRGLRLGMANPIPGQKNVYLKPEDMKGVVDRLFTYREWFERLYVRPGLDCGFPLCLFDDEQLAWFYKYSDHPAKFGCGPAIDIGPDMSVWSCFPLSNHHKRTLYEFDSIQDVVRFYQQKLDGLRVETGGIFDACDECRFRLEGQCAGGCVAYTAAKILGEARVRIPEVYE